MMKMIKWTALALSALMAMGSIGLQAAAGTEAKTEEAHTETMALNYDGFNQVWADEFDGDELNRSDWNVELHEAGWVNAELQEYVDSENNIQVRDGMLYINPVKTVEYEQSGEDFNLLPNADFSEGMNHWTETIANWDGSYVTKAASTVRNGQITYEIENPGTEDWHIQLKQEGLSLKAGVTYQVSFTITSSVTRMFKTGIMSADYSWYGGLDPEVYAGEETVISFEITMDRDDPTAQFYISIGQYPGVDTPAGTITISNVKMTSDNENQTSTRYTSGRISTQNKQTFTYGLFEVRAKVPEGQGFLPAFWLMANDENIYGQWPRCGEIDAMEIMGQDTQTLYGTVHYGNPHSESQGTCNLTDDADFSSDFHTFAVEWEPGKITWYVDGVKYHEESDWYSTTEGVGTITYPAPFDQPFYVILNLAVGGNWVGNPNDETIFTDNSFVIDYIRVYQKEEYDENVTRPEKEVVLRDPDENGNYLTEADWTFLKALGGDADCVMSEGEILIETIEEGTVDYSVQLVQPNIPLLKGASYEVSFEAKASEPRTMNVDMKAPDRGYKTYMTTGHPDLTEEYQTFTYSFVMADDSDANGRLEYNMGAAGSTASIWIRNVSVRKTADPDPNAKEEKTVLANGSYVYNGCFQEGEAHLGEWNLSDPEKVSVTELADGRRLKVEGSAVVTQTEMAFQPGVSYELSFESSSETGSTLTVKLGGVEEQILLTEEFEQYRYLFPADQEYRDQTLEFTFEGEGVSCLDNVKLVEASLLKNGSFNDGMVGYEVYIDSSARASYVVDSLNEDNALDVTIEDTGDADWKVQIKQNDIPLEKGKTYCLSFRAKASEPRSIRVILQGLEPLGWPVYSSDSAIVLDTEYTTFTETFTMNADTDPNAFLSICLGKVTDQITTQHRVVIDDIMFEEVAE